MVSAKRMTLSSRHSSSSSSGSGLPCPDAGLEGPFGPGQFLGQVLLVDTHDKLVPFPLL